MDVFNLREMADESLERLHSTSQAEIARCSMIDIKQHIKVILGCPG